MTDLVEAPTMPRRRPLYKDLTIQVLAATAAGVAFGAFAPNLGVLAKPLGDGFVRLIQMVVGLIIFCTVVHGIASVRDFGKMGRLAIKALVYFEVVTSVALVIGLVAANLVHPGLGMHIDAAALDADAVKGYAADAKHAPGFGDFLLGLIPVSATQAFAKGDILQILLFSVLFGCALASLGDKGAPILDLVAITSKVLFQIVGWVMRLAPLAAFGGMAFTVSKFGLEALGALGTLIGEFYFTCLLFFLLVLAPVSAWAGFSLLKLIRYFRDELVLVIGTSSSESVFPQLTAKLKALGVEESVVGLVLPTAYSFNHDGACLYFAAATVFLAQATGVDLGWQQQLGLLLVLLFTSKGGAGVSGSALAVLALTLASTKTIPVSSMTLILGIHRMLSAAFVLTNVAGNCVATIVVGRWERAVDRERLARELDAGFRPA